MNFEKFIKVSLFALQYKYKWINFFFSLIVSIFVVIGLHRFVRDKMKPLYEVNFQLSVASVITL